MAEGIELDDICVSYEAENKYSILAQYRHQNYCSADSSSSSSSGDFNVSYHLVRVMSAQEKKPLETLFHVAHIFWTIIPTLCCFTIAQIVTEKLQLQQTHSFKRFAVEFIVIIVPVVLSVNVANEYVFYIVISLGMCLLLVLIHQQRHYVRLVQNRGFELGRQPGALTLVRATINILTAICILAIDFESFPKVFRKSRYYGAGLMDIGIGLFVFSMGSVTRRLSRTDELRKLCKVVGIILLLGLARTVVIEYIEYSQDEHEYGRHLNAFFTLGITKLIGTLLSSLAKNDILLIPIGLAVLTAHETVLSLGVADFIMNNDNERNTFFTANREGICSLPGFVAIFLISMYIGQVLRAPAPAPAQATLSYSEFMQKLKTLTYISGALWLMVLLSIGTVGIARVSCNSGYVAWVLAIAATMMVLYICVFDVILNTLWPSSLVSGTLLDVREDYVVQKLSDSIEHPLPILVQAVNRNGLCFFLLANVLTGGVNIFLAPSTRSSLESVIILCCYMLLASAGVSILHMRGIRIA